MIRTYKTPKGTDLPLMSLKGKEYLEVKYRLVWFREECSDWGIETEFLRLTAEVAVAKATIRDQSGKVVAQATKSETPEGFADFIEKAETGAVGRALALCGFGTQFCADELDEGKRIVDAPADPKVKKHGAEVALVKNGAGPADTHPFEAWKIPDHWYTLGGKFVHQCGEVDLIASRNYWLKRSSGGTNNIGIAAEEFLKNIDQCLAARPDATAYDAARAVK